MMPPFIVFPTNRIAHFVEVSLYLFYLAQQVDLISFHSVLIVFYFDLFHALIDLLIPQLYHF